MLVLPRSARLAAWGTAALGGAVDVGAAVKAVEGDDEPHDVVPGEPGGDAIAADGGTDLTLPPGAKLADLLAILAAAGATQLRVVLPGPGDVLGLPGPPWFNALAVEAGECVLIETPASGPGPDDAPAGRAWALVPQITEFGSAWEPGAMVTWRLYTVRPSRVTDLGSVAEADLELRSALEQATRELARLDVARWRDDAAEKLAAIRKGGVDPGLLPPSTPARCLRVLATAARVWAIVDLAGEDDGGAISGYEAGARTETLRGLERVSRRALVAAVNGVLEA